MKFNMMCFNLSVEFRRFHPEFDEDVFDVFDVRRSVELKDSPGGTATRAVQEQLERARELWGEKIGA